MDSGAIRLARDALATPDLRRLQLSAAAAGVGGWAFMVSLAVHAYAVGGAAAVGLAALVRMAPAGLAAPLTGLAADRFPRRDVLLAAVLARTLLLAAAALCVALDAPFALLLVLATLFTVAATAHKPAQAALLPRLAPTAPTRPRPTRCGRRSTAAPSCSARSPAACSLAGFGAAAAFAASGVAFVAAALALARHRTRRGCVRNVALKARATGTPPRSRACGSSRATGGCGCWSACSRSAPSSRAWSTCSSSSPRLHLVDLGEAGAGWLNAAWGIGGIAGGALALRLLARGRLALSLPAGGMLIGVPLLLLANLPGAVTALAALLVLGVGYALVESAGVTLLQRLAHDRVRARAFAVVESSYWLTTGAGAMLAPALIALAGPRGALALVGRGAAAADAQPLGRAHPTGAGRHWRTSGSGVSSGSTCARSFSKSGGSARRSPSASSGSSDVKPGPIEASSNRIPPGSRK